MAVVHTFSTYGTIPNYDNDATAQKSNKSSVVFRKYSHILVVALVYFCKNSSSGTGCADKEAQGGHYYDAEDIAEDPWKLASYYETSSEGEAAMIGCVLTGAGAAEYTAKPFIVHDSLGGRVLCGVLEDPPEESASATRSIVAALASILMVFALW